MKIKIFKIFFMFIVMLLAVACTDGYENINRDPYGTDAEEQSRDDYNISAPLRTIQSNIISTNINRCHQTDILLGGAYGRYASESKAGSWPNKFSTFDAPDGWSSVMFNEVITEVYPPYINMKSMTDNSISLSIAEILKVMAIHRVTDAYGPIPYSKVGVDGAIQVPYDSQKDVYLKMFEELDAAIAALTERQTESISSNADLIYDGDLVKWIRLANSVKLRLAMRIVYAEPVMAKAKAEEAVNHSVGVMASNADNAALTTFEIEGNPISVAVKYNDGDNRVVADMTTYMNAYNDPRRSAYFLKSGFPGVDYAGYRSGITIGGVTQFENYSVFNIEKTTPLQWMNVAEVMFLRAEGALRGWSMGGTAEYFYTQGVALSFSQWGVTGADAYLADAVSFPNGYTDPGGLYSYNTQLTTVTVKWNTQDEADFEKSLERIMIQKWLANFPLGQEAWADRRRTGYPKMLPVVVNNSPNGILSNTDIPRRCPYPAQEAVTNTANYNAAVGLLGGADNIATRVWWDCKP